MKNKKNLASSLSALKKRRKKKCAPLTFSSLSFSNVTLEWKIRGSTLSFSHALCYTLVRRIFPLLLIEKNRETRFSEKYKTKKKSSCMQWKIQVRKKNESIFYTYTAYPTRGLREKGSIFFFFLLQRNVQHVYYLQYASCCVCTKILLKLAN